MFHSFFNSLAKSRYLSFFSFSFNFTRWSPGTSKSPFQQVLFFAITSSGRLAEIRWAVCIKKSQNLQDRFCVVHIPFVHMVKLRFFCTIPSGLPSRPSRVLSYTLFELSCSICLSYVWSFGLHFHKTHICCFVASYLFLLWYGWSLWCCFELLLEEIQFF